MSPHDPLIITVTGLYKRNRLPTSATPRPAHRTKIGRTLRNDVRSIYYDHKMRVADERSYLFCLAVCALQQFGLVRPQCPARVVSFDDVRPPTLTQPHCAVTHDDVTQTNDKTLSECSQECADSDDCVAFNYKEPQLVCELFQTSFVELSLTPGCTYYEVCRHVRQNFPLLLTENANNDVTLR